MATHTILYVLIVTRGDKERLVDINLMLKTKIQMNCYNIMIIVLV